MTHYVLRGKRVVLEPNYLRWSMWFDQTDRVVAQTPIEGGEVGTVFIGLVADRPREGPPLVFETIVRQGEKTTLTNWYW
jgi:hypothetical protein